MAYLGTLSQHSVKSLEVTHTQKSRPDASEYEIISMLMRNENGDTLHFELYGDNITIKVNPTVTREVKGE